MRNWLANTPSRIDAAPSSPTRSVSTPNTSNSSKKAAAEAKTAGQVLPLGSGNLYIDDAPAFATKVLHWTPDPKQHQALAHPGSRVILNWARQCGKSTVSAIRALHMAATSPGSSTLVLGGVESHIAEFFAKIDSFTIGLDSDWVGAPIRNQPGKRMARVFPNGSRIVGVTTNRSVRGHAAHLVILDEAGYIDDLVWEGVLPTLATTNGAIWVIGTPAGARGWYYELWKNGPKSPTAATADIAAAPMDPWFKSLYLASENPRISPQYLAEMRLTRGEAWIRQEFGCEFLHDGQTLLHPDDVDALFAPRPNRRNDGNYWR